MIRLLALLVLLCAPLAARALPGRLESYPMMASAFVAPRNVSVWLPDGYDGDRQRHAVLYLHDARTRVAEKTGLGGPSWGVAEALTRLIASGKVRRTIVVGIDNTPLRSREYLPAGVVAALPAAERAALTAGLGGAPLSDAYLKFIVREVKPFVDARYRTDPRRSATFVIGSSMGGLISLDALINYPRVFGGAGCLSTHWPLPLFGADGQTPMLAFEPVAAAFEAYLAAGVPPRGHQRVWFDHGDQHLDRFYAPYQARVDAALAARRWRQPHDFVSRAYPGASHNETSWRARLDDPLLYLLAPR